MQATLFSGRTVMSGNPAPGLGRKKQPEPHFGIVSVHVNTGAAVLHAEESRRRSHAAARRRAEEELKREEVQASVAGKDYGNGVTGYKVLHAIDALQKPLLKAQNDARLADWKAECSDVKSAIRAYLDQPWWRRAWRNIKGDLPPMLPPQPYLRTQHPIVVGALREQFPESHWPAMQKALDAMVDIGCARYQREDGDKPATVLLERIPRAPEEKPAETDKA